MAKRGRVETMDGSYPNSKYQRIGNPEQDPQKFKFETALSFLEQVKRQFSDQPDIYKEFLRIMKEFKGQEIDTPEVIKQISTLFKGYDNLIEGFGHFLPQGHQMKPAPPPPTTVTVPASAPPPPPKRNGSTTRNVVSNSVIKLNEKEPDKKKPEKIATEARERSYPKLELSNRAILVAPNNEEMRTAKNFILKVKSRFIEQPHAYREFLEILKKHQRSELALKDVFWRFTILFSDYTDLLLEFPKFLPQPHQEIQELATVDEYTFFENAKLQLQGEPALYVEFLKCISLVNKRIISPGELLILLEDLLSEYLDLFDQFREFMGSLLQTTEEIDLSQGDVDQQANATSVSSMKLLKPLTKQRGILCKLEIDYSSCKRLGPSYRSLPREYIQPPSSGRTPLCNEVINDVWVSLPTGSEEGANFKSSRKSTFEEILFKCEDDRYELDMIIEQNFSTLQRLKELHEKMESATAEELAELRVEEFFDVIHLKPIEKVYGEKKKEIICNLFNNPAVTIPLLLRRLKQKDEEWRALREEWSKPWRTIHENNYHKSLDHQCTTIKQKDKKLLTFREFLMQINKEKFFKTKQNSMEDHLSYQVDYPHIFIDLFNILQVLLKASPQYTENSEFELFLEEFLKDFLMVNDPESVDAKLLYGSDEFFFFIRMIVTGYTRIAKIMEGSCEMLRHAVPTAIRSADPMKRPAVAKFKSLKQLYRYYIDDMLLPLINNEMDSTKYEEECKKLFGVDAYLLFTIDRILKACIEEIELICSDDYTMRLLALYYYETKRVFEGPDNYVYRTNACEIIGKERLFRITYTTESNGRKLNISLMDHPNEYPALGLSTAKNNFKKYLQEFLGPNSLKPNVKTSVFLRRNKLATARKKNWNENLIIHNHLEAKICMTTFRMFYVSNTEDFFYRKGSLTKAEKFDRIKHLLLRIAKQNSNNKT